MKTKRIFSGLIGAIMAISATISTISATINAVDAKNDAFVELNQSQIVKAMGASWNLGNQFDAYANGKGDETAWGNPVTKKELIQAVKKAGFKSIRIPVTYMGRIGDAPNYTIEKAWLNRVQEVVDWSIENDLYVIINIHHDGNGDTKNGAWINCSAKDQTDIVAKFTACWEQISKKFAGYDEHLIFESMNEVGASGSPNTRFYNNINNYNQIFVDTVRRSGGNNAKRWLLVPGWYTNIDYTVKDYGFVVPTDEYRDSSIPADENRIMVSVHYYDPWDFGGDDTSGIYSQWGNNANPSKKVSSWDCDEDYMEAQIKKMYNKFVKEGYPVIIGEYGCINKEASDLANTLYRAYYIQTMCELTKKYGCVPVYWDNGAIGNSFGLINRNTCEIEQPEIIDAMMSVYLTSKENTNKYIDIISALDSTSYTSETWTSLNTALTNAKNLLLSDSATEEQLEEAYNALNKAYYKLMPDANYVKEQVVATSDTVKDSDTANETDGGLAIVVKPDTLSVVSSKLLTLKFKVVSGTPAANDNILVMKPYSTNGYDGWNDNFIKLSQCTQDSSTKEYTFTIDPQEVLKSYTGKNPTGADSINIEYATKGTSTNIQITYCSFSLPVAHTRHHYEVTDETFTCTQDGEKTYACTACGDEFTEEVKAMHIWDKGIVTVEEKCTDSGLKVYKCTKCGETKERVITATGHFWDPYTVTKEATCTETGSQTRKCTVCDKEETKVIKAIGHKYDNGVCTKCGAKDLDYKPTTKTPTTTKTSVKTTRSADVVKKDKAVAKKAMKQAKITKLTVKSKAKKKIAVSWRKVKKAKGYQVQVSAKKNYKKVIFKKFVTKNKLTIKNSKISSKKTYYVRVRAYATYLDANGKAQKVYSKWNKQLRKVKVK